MVADLFSLLAQTASPKGEAEKGRIAQTASPKGEAGKGRIAQSASTERKTEKGTKDSRGVGKGKAGKGLVRRLEQTSSVCLRRQLPRRGKPRGAGTIPRRAGIKIDEVYTHIRLRIRGNRFRKAIL